MDSTAQTARLRVAGALAAGLAIGLGELMAGLVDGIPSPLNSIGTAVVDWSPPFLKDFAIAVFGTGDKLALAIGTTVMAVLIGAGIGPLWRRHPALPAAVIAGFAAVGIAAGLGQPLVEPVLVVAAGVVSGATAVLAMEVLARWSPEPVDPTDGLAGDRSRRRFLAGAAGVAGVAAVGGVVGRTLVARIPEVSIEAAPVGATLTTVPRPTPAQVIDIEGITPLIVPNDEFYRIDTALTVPRIEPSEWELRVTGLVDEELRFSYADLEAMPLVEQYSMLACVSNQVGGDLAGTARWTGVRLTDLLERAGVQPTGKQIVGRSIDDFTAGFPTELAFDGREPLVVLAMNGEPLPRQHGFPARLVVPGLYGYVSATKWLTEIQLADETFDGYWVPRGWSKLGPIKIQSRIDTPRNQFLVDAVDGRVTFGGVAWAPLEGVEAVELLIDDTDWERVTLADPLSERTWVQWKHEVPLERGPHTAEVRAIDGKGNVQTAERQPPRPNGATGHHRIRITVRA